MWRNRCIIFMMVCFGGQGLLSAQNVVSTETFMDSVLGGLNFEEQAYPLVSKLNLIEEVQLRTETRDFDFKQQEYSLRLRPANRKISRSQQRIVAMENTKHSVDLTELKEEILLESLLAWVRLKITSDEKKISQNRLKNITDQIQLVQRQLPNKSEEIYKLSVLLKDKHNILLDISECEAAIRWIKDEYNLKSDSLDFSSWINLEGLEKNINTLEIQYTQGKEKGRDYQASQEKEKQLKEELRLEKLKTNRFFDYAQVKYIGPHENLLQERVSVGMGFQLDRPNSRKLKQEELRAELDFLDRSKNLEQQLYEKKFTKQIFDLSSNLSKYNSLVKLRDSNEDLLHNFERNLTSASEISLILTALKSKELILSIKLELLELENTIHEEYLELLDMAGGLVNNRHLLTKK